MQIVKILLISLVGALVAGAVIGLIIGWYLRKKANSNSKPVFSNIQKIFATVSVLLGIGLIVTGVVLPKFMEPNMNDMNQMGMEGEEPPDTSGGAMGGSAGGDAVATPAPAPAVRGGGVVIMG